MAIAATYCTAEDVRAALAPGGTQASGETAADLSDWQISDAIVESQDIVNAYTSAYDITMIMVTEVSDGDPNAGEVPFEVAPDPIRRWTRSIAAYYAALTYRKNKDLPEGDPVRLRYEAVMAMLERVRNGSVIIDLPKKDTSAHDVEIFNPYDGTLFGPEDFCLGPDEKHVQVLRPLNGWWP
jgi:phage gp36-like protein